MFFIYQCFIELFFSFFLRTFFLLLVSPMRYHLYYIIGAST
nr:MAG TPA: hypothetical protein [Caudoviricetes sp.]DAL64190.1 MAG TPA_asm: hypothetical protein [Caudoviricetes sp.]DAW69389.1 MAG TPA: hypothetical protein [Caudoviricetes sp.]